MLVLWKTIYEKERKFCFLSDFLSQTLTIHRTAEEGRGPSFILLYHFYPLMKIETCICNFSCEMTIMYFFENLVFTRLLLDEIYYLVELPFDWLFGDAMFVCLLDELILDFSYCNLTWKTRGFELASTIILVFQANRLTKSASHPMWMWIEVNWK